MRGGVGECWGWGLQVEEDEVMAGVQGGEKLCGAEADAGGGAGYEDCFGGGFEGVEGGCGGVEEGGHFLFLMGSFS